MNRNNLNRRFDLSGNEISRLLKISFFGKVVPIGNLRGGPGGRCLIVLSILHYCGYPMYWLQARYGHRLALIRRVVGKIIQR